MCSETESSVSCENIKCLQSQTHYSVTSGRHFSRDRTFSALNKTMKVEMTKASYGLAPLMTKSPESWHSQTERALPGTHVSEPQSVRLATGCTPVHAPSRWWRPERIFSLATKPSSQATEQNTRETSSSFLHREPQPSSSEQTPAW